MSFVLHGHAHRGQLEGATKSGVPVYNVSLPLLARSFPDRPTFRLFEVPIVERPQGDAAPAQSTSTPAASGPLPEPTAAPPAPESVSQLVGATGTGGRH